MIRTVIFDLGNVILPFDVASLATRLSKYSPFSPNEILNYLWQPDLAHPFEQGEFSQEVYFERVTRSLRFEDIDFELFKSIYNDIFEEDLLVSDIIRKLKGSYRLGLISNINAIHAEHIKATYDTIRHFERVVFSNEAGLRKPHPRIYQMALSTLQADPAETVFIDDTEENVHAARRLGIHGIHFKVAGKLQEDLAGLGVEV